jgi:hypothetical protein
MTPVQDMFWLVWCPTGSQPPQYRHVDYLEAVREAERLAKSAPGQQFYVLAAESMRVVDNMQRVEFARPIPF